MPDRHRPDDASLRRPAVRRTRTPIRSLFMNNHLVLRFRGPDRAGIVAGTTTALAEHGCNVRDAQVYGDEDTGSFFCRMALSSPLGREALASALSPVAS